MAVTKQTYTAAATWTSTQFADLLRSAFIDAGYMADWYDSFSVSGSAHRVLEVVYNSGKVYGKTYYWFIFDTLNSKLTVQPCTGWNVSTHVPTGTQYLDYWNTNTSVNYGSNLMSTAVGTAVSIIRYTSQVDNSHSWFMIKNGTNYLRFTVARPSHQVASWIDLDKNQFAHFITASPVIAAYSAVMAFSNHAANRRSYGLSAALNGYTSSSASTFTITTACYVCPGRTSADFGNNFFNTNSGFNASSARTTNIATSILLPNALSSSNPAYAANYNPVVSGVPYSFYMTNSNFPSDFAIIPHYANNTLASEDTFVVTAGVEEYEILVAANGSVAATTCSIAFAARTI